MAEMRRYLRRIAGGRLFGDESESRQREHRQGDDDSRHAAPRDAHDGDSGPDKCAASGTVAVDECEPANGGRMCFCVCVEPRSKTELALPRTAGRFGECSAKPHFKAAASATSSRPTSAAWATIAAACGRDRSILQADAVGQECRRMAQRTNIQQHQAKQERRLRNPIG